MPILPVMFSGARQRARVATASGRVIGLLIAVAVVVFCALASAVALAGAPHRADLRISAAVLRGSAPGDADVRALSGRATLENRGHATATRFAGRLTLVADGGRSVVVRRYAGRGLRAGRHVRLSLFARLPAAVRTGHRSWEIRLCALVGSNPLGRPRADGCRRIGRLVPRAAATGGGGAGVTVVPILPGPGTSPTMAAGTGTGTTGTTPRAPTSQTTTTVTTTTTGIAPTAPIPYVANQAQFIPDGLGQYENTPNALLTSPDSYSGYFTSGYYLEVPPSYDPSNQTPETLVVWMHGCGGSAHWDAQDLTTQADSDRPYILISLNGPEAAGGSGPSCWDITDQTDVAKVLTDVSDVESHFNIDRRRVIIAGYSSGGDLAYLTIFGHADTFAGILAANTNPVRDNSFGPDGIADAINSAGWKFPGIQLSHADDDVYHVDPCGYDSYPACPTGDPSGSTSPDVGVAPQISALQNAGFAFQLVVKPGHHYDADVPTGCNDVTPNTCTGGTDYDIVNVLLSTIGTDGWLSPAS